MIHYHGGPITPQDVAIRLWTGRHAMISFFNPDQIELAAEVCQSFALDNGAFSAWRAGSVVTDWSSYYEWVSKWTRHPGCDFALIPDVIDGGELENDLLITEWLKADLGRVGVPVWHLHESLVRLEELVETWPRIALGSSGSFSEPGSDSWWDRMSVAMNAICDKDGRPFCRLHGLRMLDPTIFSHLPFASADSTNVARNHGHGSRWDASAYAPRSKAVRALVIADRIEHHASAATWRGTFGIQQNLELFG